MNDKIKGLLLMLPFVVFAVISSIWVHNKNPEAFKVSLELLLGTIIVIACVLGFAVGMSKLTDNKEKP